MELLAEVTYDNAAEAAASAAAATSNGAAQVALATTQANNAAASAASALNAPGTNATSTTSLAVGTGSKTLTIQTGKAYAVGQSVIVARTSDPAGARMGGVITAHNSGTGSLTVIVSVSFGSGTFTDWTVSLGTISPGAAMSLPVQLVSTNTTAVAGFHYVFTATATLTLPASWTVDDVIEISCGLTTIAPSIAFGSTKLRGETPGTIVYSDPRQKIRVQYSGNATYGLV
jgi:hypothetical protein